MSDKFEITQKEGVVKIDVLSPPSVDEMKSVLDEIVDYPVKNLRLWDFRKVEMRFPFESISEIASHSQSVIKGKDRVAFLVNDTESYKIKRQHSFVTEIQEDSNIQIFQEEDEAISWLLKKT